MAAKKAAKGTEVVKWDEELARQAAVSAGMEESTATGQFFGTKGGQLSFNDAPFPNNEMVVVILDTVLENVFYEGKYDPDAPQAPLCFAFGRTEEEMVPHKVVFDAGNNQSDQCRGCEMNEWASADTGRGKACRNTRRLAMIPAGAIDQNGKFKAFTDEAHYVEAGIAYMRLPVTSVKGYAAFVKQVSGALKRPPFGVFTRVKLVPDTKTQFKITFEALSEVPDELLGAIVARNKEAQSLIEFPYAAFEEVEAPKKPARGKPAPVARKGAKPVAKKASARKY